MDSLEEYRRFKEEIDRQQAEITARIEELEAKVDPALAAAQLRESISATLRTLEAPDVSLTEKNSAVRSLFDSCTYNKAASTLEITYRLCI